MLKMIVKDGMAAVLVEFHSGFSVHSPPALSGAHTRRFSLSWLVPDRASGRCRQVTAKENPGHAWGQVVGVDCVLGWLGTSSKPLLQGAGVPAAHQLI
jgi:hypothetical protein